MSMKVPSFTIASLIIFPISLTEAFYRPTWIEVDLSAIRSNVQAIKKYIGEDVHLMAAIKGNACGYGMVEVAKASIAAGATWIGVATLDEALVVRLRLRNRIPILVMGYVDPHKLSVASRYNITVTAVSLDWIKSAAKIATRPFNFHLKIDTGLNRVGCRTFREVKTISALVSNDYNLNWTGVFTHLATAGNPENQDYMRRQLSIFEDFLDIIPDRDDKTIHCANSQATLYYPDMPHYDMVRIGRGVTGPPEESLKRYQLFPLKISIELHSTLVNVKELEAGEYVGYDCEYVTREKQWVGTVPIGYADGWHQHYANNDVLVDGERMPIIGLIAMDQLTVALPRKYAVGTRVTLIGRQGFERIYAEEIAATARVPRSQVYSSLSHRIPRLYYENGRLITIDNMLLNQVSQL